MSIDNRGEIEASGFDSSNVPVNLFIEKLTKPKPLPENAEEMDIEEHKENMDIWDAGYRWKLAADAFMPRKGLWEDNVLLVYTSTRREVSELLEEHILPFYQLAHRKIIEMVEGTTDSLYYWEE